MRGRRPLGGGLAGIHRDKRFSCGLAQFAAQIVGDLPSVEAAILDKNLVGVHPRDNYTGQIDSRNIAFKRVRVYDRLRGSFL